MEGDFSQNEEEEKELSGKSSEVEIDCSSIQKLALNGGQLLAIRNYLMNIDLEMLKKNPEMVIEVDLEKKNRSDSSRETIIMRMATN